MGQFVKGKGLVGLRANFFERSHVVSETQHTMAHQATKKKVHQNNSLLKHVPQSQLEDQCQAFDTPISPEVQDSPLVWNQEVRHCQNPNATSSSPYSLGGEGNKLDFASPKSTLDRQLDSTTESTNAVDRADDHHKAQNPSTVADKISLTSPPFRDHPPHTPPTTTLSSTPLHTPTSPPPPSPPSTVARAPLSALVSQQHTPGRFVRDQTQATPTPKSSQPPPIKPKPLSKRSKSFDNQSFSSSTVRQDQEAGTKSATLFSGSESHILKTPNMVDLRPGVSYTLPRPTLSIRVTSSRADTPALTSTINSQKAAIVIKVGQNQKSD